MVRRLRFSGPKTSIICSPMTSLKTREGANKFLI
ncbi:hypothetical protein BZG17_24955 [Escherichia coli]|nr:hypothetical protein [Escherichia coli]